jgi:uncharacterized membrane protein
MLMTVAKRRSSGRSVLRVLAGILFVLAGANHFRSTRFYQRIIPPGFGSPAALVAISGVCEIAGGLGLLYRPLRRAAGWGLIALLIAVSPANIYMAVRPEWFEDMHLPRWTFWARLPLQFVFIAWIWFVSLSRGSDWQELNAET